MNRLFNFIENLALNQNRHLINGIGFESDSNRTTMTKLDFELDSPIQIVSPNRLSLNRGYDM